MQEKVTTESIRYDQLEYLSMITPEDTLPTPDPTARQVNMTAKIPMPTDRWLAMSRRVGPNMIREAPCRICKDWVETCVKVGSTQNIHGFLIWWQFNDTIHTHAHFGLVVACNSTVMANGWKWHCLDYLKLVWVVAIHLRFACQSLLINAKREVYLYISR